MKEICLTKDSSLVAKQTPVYMRTVESFSLRVKQLLYVNNCDTAFSVDLLQNKPKTTSKAKPTKTKKEKNVLRVKVNIKRSESDQEELGNEAEEAEEEAGAEEEFEETNYCDNNEDEVDDE
jgi:hypothetical protein